MEWADGVPLDFTTSLTPAAFYLPGACKLVAGDGFRCQRVGTSRLPHRCIAHTGSGGGGCNIGCLGICLCSNGFVVDHLPAGKIGGCCVPCLLREAFRFWIRGLYTLVGYASFRKDARAEILLLFFLRGPRAGCPILRRRVF